VFLDGRPLDNGRSAPKRFTDNTAESRTRETDLGTESHRHDARRVARALEGCAAGVAAMVSSALLVENWSRPHGEGRTYSTWKDPTTCSQPRFISSARSGVNSQSRTY
jgi:hypothetical protein